MPPHHSSLELQVLGRRFPLRPVTIASPGKISPTNPSQRMTSGKMGLTALVYIPRFARDGRRASPSASCYLLNQATSGHYTIHLTDLREPVEDTLCPSGTACLACVKRHRTHRVRGATVWRGQALRFAPLPLCLSRRASEGTDPAIPSALDGLKYSRLLPSSCLSTALGFGRHFRGRDQALRSDRSSSRRLRPPGSLRSASQSGGYGSAAC